MTIRTVEVEVDISDFPTHALIDELEYRGEYVYEISSADTDDLIEELQSRNYIVCKGGIHTRDQERALHELYLDYVEGKNTNKSVKEVLDKLYMYVPLRSV